MVGVASAALVLAMASLADAQVFYSYPGARPVTDTSPSLGLVSGFGDNVIRLGGFGRFNISPVADLGLEAIYQSVDVSGSGNDIGYGGAGIDGKYLLMSANENMPLDISAQVGAGFLARSGYFNLHIPFGAMTSHDFTTSDGRRITPYGGVYFVFDYIDGGVGFTASSITSTWTPRGGTVPTAISTWRCAWAPRRRSSNGAACLRRCTPATAPCSSWDSMRGCNARGDRNEIRVELG